jgi:hypothetical protein
MTTTVLYSLSSVCVADVCGPIPSSKKLKIRLYL